MALIWGRNPVLESLRAGRTVDKIIVASGAHPTGTLADILALARDRHVRVQYLDRRALDRLSANANHQGVVAEVPEFHYATLDDLIERGKNASRRPLIVLLDQIQDPQNLATLIRTCDAVGATGIVLPRHRSVGVTPAVEKASAGAVAHVPLAQVANVSQAIERLKENGYWIVGLSERGSTEYDQFPVDTALGIVVGAEGHGLGRLVQERCDLLVSLPMLGKVQSLNAAVAGSVVMYDILRRRHLLRHDA